MLTSKDPVGIAIDKREGSQCRDQAAARREMEIKVPDVGEDGEDSGDVL